jgi:DNA (cytosine-5)-methyltransferase 1
LNHADRKRLGLKKKCVVPLDPEQPSHTLTSLPDDLVHYSEPRILSVREYARLQTFPDWYVFKGKYTTGGSKRVRECPRYTQVANAVPPFLAEVLGRLLAGVAAEVLDARPHHRSNGNGGSIKASPAGVARGSRHAKK